MSRIKKDSVEIIKDARGNPKRVTMDYRDYRQLMEDYTDLSLMVSRLDEPRISLDELKKKLKKDGLL
jgi:hypothetical protein